MVGGGSHDNLTTVISTIGNIAKLSPKCFADHAKEFQSFVFKTLFHKSSTFDWEVKVSGIHALVEYAVTLDAESAKVDGAEILNFLVDIINSAGDMKGDDIENSYIRKAVATGIITLAKITNYDHQITHDMFNIIVRITKVSNIIIIKIKNINFFNYLGSMF